MSSISHRANIKSILGLSGEHMPGKSFVLVQEDMSQQPTQQSSVAPQAADQGVRSSGRIMAASVVNFLLATLLFTWVLLDRNTASTPSGPTGQPSVVGQQPSAVPTDAALVVEATPTPVPALPTGIPEQVPTNTPEPAPPTATFELPTETPVLPTDTPVPPPPADTPVPPPPATDTPPPPPPADTNTPVPPPPTTKPKPRPTNTPVREIVYIVRYGDTLIGIAYRYGTTVDAIMRRNGLYSTVIYAGQRLIIPLR